MSRRLASAVALGAVAVTLAACGSSTESTESASTNQARPAEAASGGSRSKSKVDSRDAKALAAVRARILHYGKATARAEAKAVGLTVAAYFFDRDGRDWPPACSYLSAKVRARLERVGGPGDDGCGKGIEATSAPVSMDPGEARIPKVKALRQKGSRAFLIYRTGARKTDAMPMVMEEGEWKLAGINPMRLFP